MADAIAPADRPLGDALRALPLEAPDTSAWPALAARIATHPKPPRARRGAWLALAASVVVGLVVAGLGPWRGSATDAVPQADSLATLEAESAQLEALLSAASDDVSGNASALVLSLQLEDRLRAVDARLSRPDLTDAERLALWQQRVAVLRVATGLESSRRYYAAQGRALEPTLVATY